MNKILPAEKAKANLCGFVARNIGVRKIKQKKKQMAEPARQAMNPSNLQERQEGDSISRVLFRSTTMRECTHRSHRLKLRYASSSSVR